MNKKFMRIVNNRMFIIILILVLISITLLVGTYAWFTWSSTDNTSFTLSIGDIADVTFVEGNNIDDELTPVFNYYDGLHTGFDINNMSIGINYNVYLNITSIAPELVSEQVKYTLVKENEVIAEGDLSSASNGSSINVYSGFLEKGRASYKFYLYIDGNVENDIAMIGKSIVGNIMVDAEVTDSLKITDYIRNLYTSGNPTLITQEVSNDSYYYSYQDESNTWGLMNDGLTIDTTQDATTTGLAKVVTDTDALTKGTEGNIRYFGSSDKVNNYIYFNCNDYSNQSSSTCERWRIIGIVDGKVKIIRDQTIGDMAWDFDYNDDLSSEDFSHLWSEASLKKLLNTSYYNGDTSGTVTYYSLYGDMWDNEVVELKLNMNDIGIKNNTTRGLISPMTWYLGKIKYLSQYLYPNDLYINERTNGIGVSDYGEHSFLINENIGLMNASDYAYATDLIKCSNSPYYYDESANSYACRSNNWLFKSGIAQWLINQSTGITIIRDNGRLDYEFSDLLQSAQKQNNMFFVYPVLYLEPELGIKLDDGDGSYDTPYKISVGGDSGNTPVESPLQLGDYISYTPSKTSYETDPDMTGYSDVQTINPSELNLWRVINKNDDGTVEIISEYVSSTDVYFQGQTGYLNFVGYLNTLAKQYETTGITSGSRHFGYNGQTEYLDPSKVQFTNPPPFTSSTTDNSNEDKGGGDILYEKDFNNVNTVLGTRVANKVGTTTATEYWMASRYYVIVFSDIDWDGRNVYTSGNLGLNFLYNYEGDFYDSYNDSALRPIVTLKPGLTYTGEGTSGSPWQIVSS